MPQLPKKPENDKRRENRVRIKKRRKTMSELAQDELNRVAKVIRDAQATQRLIQEMENAQRALDDNIETLKIQRSMDGLQKQLGPFDKIHRQVEEMRRHAMLPQPAEIENIIKNSAISKLSKSDFDLFMTNKYLGTYGDIQEALQNSYMVDLKNIDLSIAHSALSATKVLSDLAGINERFHKESALTDHKMFLDSLAQNNATIEAIRQNPYWEKQIAAYIPFESDIVSSAVYAFADHIADMGYLALDVHEHINEIDFDLFKNRYGLSYEEINPLKHSTIKLFDDYSRFYQSLKDSPSGIGTYPPFATINPMYEVIGVTNIYRSIIDPEIYDPDEETGFDIFRDDTVIFSLEGIDPKLINNFKGALLRLKESSKKNPERIRQYSATMRILLKELLKRVAPDHIIEKWDYDGKKYYKKGVFDHRTRILFLCRFHPFYWLADFIEQDINEYVNCLKFLEKFDHMLIIDCENEKETMNEVHARSKNLLMLICNCHLSNN